MAIILLTYPANQWNSEGFYRQVDMDERQEVRVAAAYDRPIDRSTIRNQVLGAILAFAIPAGNA